MMRAVRMMMCLLVSMLALTGCVDLKQPAMKIDYYSLEYDPPKFENKALLPVIIRINRFSVDPIYNTTQIVFREKSFVQNEYVYHKWRANPGDLVTYFFARDLKLSGLFKAVFVEQDIGSAASYIVQGSVDEFLEQDSDTLWSAVLSVTFTVMKQGETDVTKSILLQKQYRVTETCRQKNPRALAEAMSKAMSGLSRNAIQDIYSKLPETVHDGGSPQL